MVDVETGNGEAGEADGEREAGDGGAGGSREGGAKKKRRLQTESSAVEDLTHHGGGQVAWATIDSEWSICLEDLTHHGGGQVAWATIDSEWSICLEDFYIRKQVKSADHFARGISKVSSPRFLSISASCPPMGTMIVMTRCGKADKSPLWKGKGENVKISNVDVVDPGLLDATKLNCYTDNNSSQSAKHFFLPL